MPSDMCRILLIDDDERVRTTLLRMLESLGHEATAVESGSRGLELFDQGGFDLVITDIVMPDMEGLEVIMELRRRDPVTRIIAISGGTPHMPSGTCLQPAALLGAESVLQKPFGLKELCSAVDASS
jgi:two-component system chemotaxis response regulator CheY